MLISGNVAHMARDRYQPRQRDIIRNESRRARNQSVNKHGQRQLTQYARDLIAQRRGTPTAQISHTSEWTPPAGVQMSSETNDVASDDEQSTTHAQPPGTNNTVGAGDFRSLWPHYVMVGAPIHEDGGFWRRLQHMQERNAFGMSVTTVARDPDANPASRMLNSVTVQIGDDITHHVYSDAPYSGFVAPTASAINLIIRGEEESGDEGSGDEGSEEESEEESDDEPSYQPFARRTLTRADEHVIRLVEGLVCSVCAEEMIVHVDTGCHLAPRRMCHECMVTFVLTQLKSAPCALCACGARLAGLDLILTDAQVSSIPHHVAPQLDDDLLDAMAALGAQRCGQCGNVVEKTGGCNHIVCICKYEFCYLCGTTWRGCKCPMFS